MFWLILFAYSTIIRSTDRKQHNGWCMAVFEAPVEVNNHHFMFIQKDLFIQTNCCTIVHHSRFIVGL